MTLPRIEKTRSRRWIGTALTALLLACSAVAQTQDPPKKKDQPARPAQPAGQSHSAPAGGGQAQQAPSRPSNPAPAQAQPAQQAPSRPSHSDSGQQGTPQNSNRPDRPDRSNSGQGNPQNTNRPDSQSTHQNPVQSNPVPQGTPQNMNRPDRSNSGQGNPQNTNRPDSQGTPQNMNRPDRPSNGQGNPQNMNRPDSQSTPQYPLRPSNQGSGQGMPQQNMNRPDRPNTGGQPNNNQPNNPGRPGFGGSIYQQNNQRPGNPGGGSGRPETVRTQNGGMVHRDAGGQVREVHTPGGAVITHQSNGARRIEMTRPGNRVIVTDSHGRGGYIQRPLMVSNRQYMQRTYSVRGVAYARVYRPVTYRGISLSIYTPTRYYRPAFYAYVYNPWARPVYYDWAWSGRPWYGYYSGYFSPYPSYASPTLWLTDYLFGMMLERAYESRVDSAAYASGQVGLTPDVKQAVADEVRRQLELERAEGQSQNGMYSDTPSIFADNARHVFVAYQPLGVNSNAGDCMISEGDVLQLYGNPGPSAVNAEVVILASKGMDCRRGAIASVPIQELQEMQNEMRATLDQGLTEFQSRNGKGGLPPLPPATDGVVNASFAGSVTPDANVVSELSQVAQEADRSEQDVVRQIDAPQAGGSGPITISFGQSIDEVVSILNQPEKIVDLGAKKIYVYKDMKITFTDGRVSDVQ